jgi:2-oxoisovalerate dehydrogenase E1 component
MRDLHGEGDGAWMCHYPPPDAALPQGEVGVHGDGTELAIVSYANGNVAHAEGLVQMTQQIYVFRHLQHSEVGFLSLL